MRIWILLIMLCTASCGSLRHTIDRDLLNDVTIENKLILFDAENDVSIAIDERDRIARQIYDTKLDIRDAESQIIDAQEDEDRSSQRNDNQRAQLAANAQDVFQLKVDYLEEYLDFLRAKLVAQDELIIVAQAKYELAKAKLVKKNNVRGSQDVELEDFEEQVGKFIEKAKDTRGDLAAIEKEVEGVKLSWLAARNKLMAASGGGLGSPWAEDSGLWGDDL